MTVGSSEVAALPATSPDVERLGVVSSSPLSINDEPGRGSIFSPAGLAAGRLVHAHQVAPGKFLLLFSDSWTSATLDPAVPGSYSAKTAVARPSAYWVDTAVGSAVPATERGATPGQLYPQAPVTLVAASSFGSILYALVILDGSPAVLFYRVRTGVLEYLGNTWLPAATPTAAETVTWNKGILLSGNYAYVVGEQPTSHALYLSKYALSTAKQAPLYLGARGWTPRPAELTPLRSASNTALTSLGPVSLARHMDDWYLSTTAKPATETIASFHRARNPFSGFRRLAKTLSLGTGPATGAFFVQAVHANPRHASLLDRPDVIAGFPVTYATETASALRTAWDVLPIPRASV